MSPAALDIIIVNHNTADDLEACLASLHEQPPVVAHHICVVDNASTDDSVARAGARFPDVEIVAQSRNGGFAQANNVGIRCTRAPLILLLNSDTRVPAGAIDRLVERLEITGATAAGPRLVDAHGHPEVSFGPMLSPGELRQKVRVAMAASRSTWATRRIARLLAREHTVDWVTGAALLVRRHAAEAVGLLDERYFMYEEDVDFCAALRATGGRILFTPAAEIVHLRGRSFSTTGRTASPLYDRSHLRFYEKHLPHWAPVLRLWLTLRGRRIG